PLSTRRGSTASPRRGAIPASTPCRRNASDRTPTASGRPDLAPARARFHPGADRRIDAHARAGTSRSPGGTPAGCPCPPHASAPSAATAPGEDQPCVTVPRHSISDTYRAPRPVERRLHPGHLAGGEHDHGVVVDVVHVVHEHVAVRRVAARDVRELRFPVV